VGGVNRAGKWDIERGGTEPGLQGTLLLLLGLFKQVGNVFLRGLGMLGREPIRAGRCRRDGRSRTCLPLGRLRRQGRGGRILDEVVGRGWEEPVGNSSDEKRRVEVQWFTVG
jgi:hypothetical protein